MKIGDVFFKALLEDKQLQVDAVKVGDKAGMTLGERMSKGIGVAMKAGLGVVAGAAAIATKGLVELDDVTAQFVADTGATAEEAERARKAILKMSGDNIQPMEEIGRTLGTVHTDLGAVGDEAEDLTEDFLAFSRVTKRDASEEVAAFDDILDAWNLTADKSGVIMDKLVVSHQEYGGSIAADEAALASMAPQLKAFNLGIDDGIGLLNLFKSSGLDAASIPRALNSAIQKLDGKPLSEFIEELASIEDPGKRAQRAIEVFGSRAGVQLANAIRPGVRSLDDFKISAEEAAGATDKARDAIDGTFSNRVQLAIKGVTAKIIEFGDAFGPALTGVASIASLGGALGLDRFVVTFAKKMLEAGKAGGESLIDGIGTVTGTAGTIFGNLIAKIIDPTEKLLGNPLRRAGAAAGALWSRAFAVGAKIAEALAALFGKLPGAGLVRSAVLASSIQIGTLSGTAMGTAAGVAFRVGFLAALAAIAEDVHKASLDIAKEFNLPKLLGIDFDPHPERWPWPLGPRASAASNWFFNLLPESIRQGAKDAFGVVAPAANEAMADLSNFPGKVADDLGEGFTDGAATVAAGAETGITDPIVDAAVEARKEAVKAIKPTPRQIADSLRDGQFHVKDAVEAIKDVVKNTLSKTKEIAQLEGFLAGRALAKALKDRRPEVRAEAEAWKAAAEERLYALQHNVPNIAQRTGQNYADALERKKTQVGRAAERVINRARGEFNALRSDAFDIGARIGQNLANGLLSKLGAFGYATALYAGKMEALLRLRSPAKEGPLSEGGGPEGWAVRGAELYAQGWSRVVPALDRVFSGLPVPQLNPVPSVALAGAGALGAGIAASMPAEATNMGGLTINGGIHVTVRGGMTNAETGNAVAAKIHDTMANVLRQQNARLPSGSRS